MPKETTEQALKRISRNIVRMTRSDQIPRLVVEYRGYGWCTFRTVYPPGYEHEPAENPQERPEEEDDDRSDGVTHNID